MIIASLHTIDEHSDVDCRSHVYLGGIPFPGDLVSTACGQLVRVIRRTFIDHGVAERYRTPGAFVDVELTVRKVTPTDG